MAITRAQQAKQMLKDGGPMRKIKGQDHMLAYITPNEADKLVKLGGQETMTPEGIPAYPPSDYYGGTHSSKPSRTTTNNPPSSDSGSDARESYITNYSSKGIVKGGGKKVGVDKDGSPIFEDSTPSKEVRDRQRKNYQNQFTSKGIAPPGPNRKARQRALNYINKNMLINYNRFTNPPTNFLSPTGYPNYGIPNIYQGINEALAAGKTLEEILEEGNRIPVGKSGLSYELNPIPDLDIDSIRELAAQQSKFGSLTGYQADSLGKLRKDIEKRDNFIETGDTSNIFPPPPTGAPDDNDPEPLDPCKGPNPPAYCFIGEKADETVEAQRNLGGLSARIGGSLFDFDQFAAEGGRIGAMDGGMMSPEGGIMDLESARDMYFVGGLVKSAKKAVKSATRAVKKIAKSPIGKAALLYGLGAVGGSFGSTGKFFSKGMFNPGNIGRGLFGANSVMMRDAGLGDQAAIKGLFGKLGLTGGYGGLMPTLKGGMTLATILPLLAGKTDEEKDDILDKYLASQKLTPSQSVRGAGSEFDFYNYNLAEGGMPSKEPVAKETMPLLDMDGQEMDLRAEGGFVPIGRMEKADDVPARLSKNEFVFTADAVRNAGDGNVDKGAEVMYNMMKNLESGGDVSEESQGLEGAREMFQTSKRLEEVL